MHKEEIGIKIKQMLCHNDLLLFNLEETVRNEERSRTEIDAAQNTTADNKEERRSKVEEHEEKLQRMKRL